EVTAFIRAHEFGHIKLGHLNRSMFDANPYFHLAMVRSKEIAADEFATKYWMKHNKEVIDVVVRKFESPFTGNYGDATHLPTVYRAGLIRVLRDKLVAQTEATNDEEEPQKKTCPRCDGSTTIRQSSQCTACFGSGRLTCVYCLGTGVVHNVFGQTFFCVS